MSEFAQRLIAWHRSHGRHDLPWQKTSDPYRIWLSEIMLQQTQVATVIPYYLRFLARFPDLATLARASSEEVMSLWSGLGYYARARNLQRCAALVMSEHGGVFPSDPEAIAQLPGIGRSTANAIAAFCFGARTAILDGNVKRVLCRCFGVTDDPGTAAASAKLWRLAESLLPQADVDAYTQAQMDLGATVCARSKPACLVSEQACPLTQICVARATGRTGELPRARAKRVVPKRERRVLILRDLQGRVLLLSRPPSGIWGGLISLPELSDDEDAQAHARDVLGCEAESFRELPTLRHSFTHFQLTLHPLLAQVRVLDQAREAAGQHWIAEGECAEAPLPAPIRKLLQAAFALAG